ncbi:hypothetical protein FRC10_004264 [Ceratobasidium sp. 414]|nr:hypothetical protein FRC10_004264 [Ceratobasidium sp. 414]
MITAVVYIGSVLTAGDQLYLCDQGLHYISGERAVMRFALASFAAAAATLSLAQPHVRAGAGMSINPDIGAIPGVTDWSNVTPAPQANTNGKRFAMKLPPLAPRAHHPQRAAPHRLGSRVQAAARSQSSPSPPVTQHCNILVQSATQIFGFLSKDLNSFGEYGLFVPSQSPGALEVSFPYSPDSPSRIDFTAVNNQAPAFPFVGGGMLKFLVDLLAADWGVVVGFASTSDNFGPGSYNYGYIAGTGQTPPGSSAMLLDSTFGTATGVPTDSESAIWVYNPNTQAITAQWINIGGGAPATSFVYANDFNQALLITGDANVLRSTFGAPYPDVVGALPIYCCSIF